MAVLIQAHDLASAWVGTLRAVHDLGGATVNVVTAIAAPTLDEHAGLRAVLDSRLRGQMRGDLKLYPVSTVANTIFPQALYRAPEGCWTPDNAKPFDDAANRLYARYRRNYPLLRKTAHANVNGTYFGRLVAWDVQGDEPLNQLALRIKNLRAKHAQNVGRWNLNELVPDNVDEMLADEASRLQMYRPSDHRGTANRGFPCLVHVDVSVFESKIHLTGMYRHQLLITKGYGNLLGLARLQQFIAQQTGYGVGELCMVGGFSDGETKGQWGKAASAALLRAAEGAVA